MTVITYFNQKGGVGKSTLTFNLAYLFSLHYRTIMWDLDSQKALSALSGIFTEKKKNFQKVLKTAKTINKKIIPTEWENLFIIPSSDDLENIVIDLNEMKKSTKAVSKIAGKIDDEYEICMIDPPPAKSLLIENILKAVDYIFIPLIPNPLNFQAMHDSIDFIKSIGMEKKIRGIIFNMLDTRKKNHRLTVEAVQREYPQYYLEHSIPQCSKVEEMQYRMKPVEVFAKSSTAAEAIRNLFHITNALVT